MKILGFEFNKRREIDRHGYLKREGYVYDHTDIFYPEDSHDFLNNNSQLCMKILEYIQNENAEGIARILCEMQNVDSRDIDWLSSEIVSFIFESQQP